MIWMTRKILPKCFLRNGVVMKNRFRNTFLLLKIDARIFDH